MDKSFLKIDINELDKEWLRQPLLYGELAEKLANARRSLDICKARYEITKAEIANQVREDPKQYGIDRISQPKVEAAVIKDPVVHRRNKALIKAHHEVNVLQGAVVAMDHKKRALESLVKLHGQSYFSSPAAEDSDKESIDESIKHSVRRRVNHRSNQSKK